MLLVAMKRTPSVTYGSLHPTPIAVVAGAFFRAWARIAERVNGGRRVLERAMICSGELDSLLVQHAVRHGMSQDGTHRVFRAPDLVYCPSARIGPRRAGRTAYAPGSSGPGTARDSR